MNKYHSITIYADVFTDYDLHIQKRLAEIAECDEDFADYLHNDWSHKVKSGYMSFIYVEKKLYVITKYLLKEPLNDAEIAELMDYTQGQWSDGIGENFEQMPIDIDGKDYFLSPWYRGQEINYTELNLDFIDELRK